MKKVIVKQERSHIGHHSSQLKTLRCLGLGKIGREREHILRPEVAGMISSVAHLVSVRELKS